jgi:hypothetical protein
MNIANPIYDVVFKYLMEDLKVARIFLSVLIGKPIEQLDPLPRELSGDKDQEKGEDESEEEQSSEPSLSIYRLDFAAKIKTTTGAQELVIIEVQKARIYNDSMRFRRYLGRQYMNAELYTLEQGPKGKERKYGLPILSIYFFGESLKGLEGRPVLHIRNQLIDRYQQEELTNDDKLLRSLYHEGIIVTIPALKPRRRDELEQLLAIFDQSNRTATMNILNIKVEDYPPKLHPILRRLQKAVKDKDLRHGMDVEDELLQDLEEYEHRIERAELQTKEERRQKEEALRRVEEAILVMLRSGFSKQDIAKSLNLSLEEVEEVEARNRKE